MRNEIQLQAKIMAAMTTSDLRYYPQPPLPAALCPLNEAIYLITFFF